MKRSLRNKSRLALLYFDIDRFKDINDEYGHQIGDALLKEFTLRLRSAIRTSDTLARWGDDEFVVISEDLNDGLAAEKVAESILDAVHVHMQVDALQLAVTTAVGIAYYNGEPNPEQLIDKADKGMYRARQGGRNCMSI